MGNFNRDRDKDRGRRSFNDRGRSQMHPAVCDDCGVRCEVPFKPTGEKPIYCSNCFEDHGGGSRRPERPNRGGDRFEKRRESKPEVIKCDNQCKEQLDKLIGRLDIIINILSTKEEVKEVPAKKKTVKKEPVKKTVKKEAIKKEPKKKVVKAKPNKK